MKKALEITGAITIITGMVGVLVILPVITFWLAYFGGFILKLFVGTNISEGLNIIFNTNRFIPDLIPISCATFATIGKYFKSLTSQLLKSQRITKVINNNLFCFFAFKAVVRPQFCCM